MVCYVVVPHNMLCCSVVDGMLRCITVCYAFVSAMVDGMAPTALHFLYLCPLSNLETGLGHCSWWPEGGRLAPLLGFGAILILDFALVPHRGGQVSSTLVCSLGF